MCLYLNSIRQPENYEETNYHCAVSERTEIEIGLGGSETDDTSEHTELSECMCIDRRMYIFIFEKERDEKGGRPSRKE